jgi:amino acid transporter
VAFQFVLGLTASVAVVLFFLILGAALAIYRLLNQSPLVWNQPLSRVRLVVSALVGVVVVVLVIQAVPFGWDRSNPRVTGEPAWDSLRTRELTVRACFDCHSNEVEYPWYSRIAPASWAVQLHVEQGRDKVNYSEWDRPQDKADKSAETVMDGEMPPTYYTLLTHDAARLTDAERQDLIDGLIATFGTETDEDEVDDD